MKTRVNWTIRPRVTLITAQININLILSCCSRDSERPHRCCLLANNFGSRRIFSILHSGPGDTPQKNPFLGDSDPPPNTWFLGPTEVHSPNGTSIGSAVFVGHACLLTPQSDAATCNEWNWLISEYRSDDSMHVNRSWQ